MAKDTEIDRIIAAHFGGVTQNLCDELKVTKGAVSQWRTRIPPRRRAEIDLYLLRQSINPPSSANVTPPSPASGAEDSSPA